MNTKFESYLKVDKNKRKMQIIEVLKKFKNGLSAKQIAIELYKNGEIPTSERNYVAPRITEMIDSGLVETSGITWDDLTQRNVKTFKLIEGGLYEKNR